MLPPDYSHVLCPGSQINEVLLFHGAPQSVLEKIHKGGFDPLRGGEGAGKLFGAGTYFTPCFSKADLYTDPDRHKPVCKRAARHVMVAKVIVGNFHLDKHGDHDSQGRRRPPDDRDTGMSLDSVLAATRKEGGAVDLPEAVIFHSQQALPMFIITYRHAENCPCHMCLRRPDCSQTPCTCR